MHRGKQMGYYIDLKEISIDEYKNILKSTTLIPSWKVLEKDIDANLNLLKANNVRNLDELLIALKDKEKIQGMSKITGLSEAYLSVLKRVVNGYRQKPNRIRDFSCIDEDVVKRLDEIGIKNSLQLYEKVKTQSKRRALSKTTGIHESVILTLTKLADLSRIRWVNHTFAYVLLESGYDTAEKIATADHKNLYITVKRLNQERKIYKASIGERDMEMIIDSAKGLSADIEY